MPWDYNPTHIRIWVTRMKTTIELPEALMSQAKATARAQGLSLKSLIERGLQMAMSAPAATKAQAAWPDLSFKPSDGQGGALIDASQWREMANQTPGFDRGDPA